MRYYVTADVHGYYTYLITALEQAGFFRDTEPHKLIICGDVFDRGEEALQLQAFILDLMEKDQVILVRGNHEDLAMQLLGGWYTHSYLQPHHHHNGTIDSFCQLTGHREQEIYTNTENVYRDFWYSAYVQKIIPAMVDYFETQKYIFVHGWIPCHAIRVSPQHTEYTPVENWRKAEDSLWSKARWVNGMEAAHAGILEKGKTIVCGHWHCSFGHANYHQDGAEYGMEANYAPYYAPGIIALDACAPRSHMLNCIVIEDECT